MKQVEMLRELRPRVATVAILHDSPPGVELIYRARYLTTINARTATPLGIPLTAALRLRADRVIE